LTAIYLESSSPGRTRLRLPKGYRGARGFDLEVVLKTLPGVDSALFNPTTGSILIHHNRRFQSSLPLKLEDEGYALQVRTPGSVDYVDVAFSVASVVPMPLGSSLAIAVTHWAYGYLRYGKLPSIWSIGILGVEAAVRIKRN
jgi:hypothetical protein